MKKVIVASFQRSGTHFLLNHLESNFAGIQNGWVDILNRSLRETLKGATSVDLPSAIRDQLWDYYPLPGRRCVKTHYQGYFFDPYIEAILEKYDVLYMVRDPRDTMVSCYHYYNFTRYEPFIQEPVFSKFLRADLAGVKTETDPFSYSLVKPRNIVDKWNQHVLSWLRFKDRGVHFVKFSDLKLRWEATLQTIARHTSQKLKAALQPVSIDDPRVRPDFKREGLHRGEIGAWRGYFSAEDLAFLNCNLSDACAQFLDDMGGSP